MSDVPPVPQRVRKPEEHQHHELPSPPAIASTATWPLLRSAEPAAEALAPWLMRATPFLAGAAEVLIPENAGEQVFDENQDWAKRLADLPFDESRVYPHVAVQPAAATAMTDFKRCDPKFHSLDGNSRHAFSALKRSLPQPPAGWHWHHLVEQSRTAFFGTQAIQNTANVIAIPDALHTRINSYYASKPPEDTVESDYLNEHPGMARTIRNYVNSLFYEEQRKYNIDLIRDLLRDRKVNISEQAQKIVEQQLDTLERDLCQLHTPHRGFDLPMDNAPEVQRDTINRPHTQKPAGHGR